MTKLLLSPQNPDGQRLEDVLHDLRADLLLRCAHIVDDPRPDARILLGKTIEIMDLLGRCLDRARESARALDRLP